MTRGPYLRSAAVPEDVAREYVDLAARVAKEGAHPVHHANERSFAGASVLSPI